MIEIIDDPKGNFVLHSYDTKKDLELAKHDIERFCLVLADCKIEEIDRFLEKYREINRRNEIND